MRRAFRVAGWMLAGLVRVHGGALAADRPVFCGTARWQPFIREAADRFRLPPDWIDAVIRAESAGCETVNGKPTTSPAGAMGLMQLMPATWREYRRRLGLGDDPFDPHDNILAGAAYLRDLYERYGSAGFLAAYQAGPGRYEESLEHGQPLPRATLDYVAHVRRAIQRMHARPVPMPAPSTPAASALFVNLTAGPATGDRSSEELRDSGLFVPLSRRRRTVRRSHRRSPKASSR